MRIVSILLMMCVLLTYSAFSQEETSPAQTGQDQPTVIDLTQMGKTYTFSARMELPQVRMFDKRINRQKHYPTNLFLPYLSVLL